MSDADALTRELEEAAARLRSGELGQDEAAALVERCAELATRLGTELDRRARSLGSELPLEPEGQEKLL